MVRVLYIEDDATQARLVQRKLARGGFHVDIAPDAESGLVRLDKVPFDVLVVDRSLPNTSGIDLVRILNREGRLPPTIVVTALGDATTAIDALQAGAFTFLLKDDRGTWLVLIEVMVRQLHERAGVEAELAAYREHLENLVQARTARIAAAQEMAVQLNRVLQQRTDELGARVKELRCLLGVSRLLQKTVAPYEEALQKICGLLPSAWQYPDIACARLVFEGRDWSSANYEETPWKIASAIWVDEKLAGAVEICYLEERPPADEGPFLLDERGLIDAVAEMVGRFVEGTRAQAEVRTLKRQIEFVLAATNTGMHILDSEWTLRYVDPGRQQRYGPFEGKKCYAYFMGRTAPCDSCGARQVLVSDQVVVGERSLPREGDRVLHVTSIPFVTDRGERLAAEVLVDITEQKQMERELAHGQKLEAIGQLAAGIAHEINTPTQYIGDNIRFLENAFNDLDGLLHSLQGLLASANAGTIDQAVMERASTALERADLEFLNQEIPRAITQSLEGVGQVSSIVRAMKEFAHPGSLAKEPVDLNRVIETTLTVCRNEWKYVAEVTTDLDPGLPPVPCFPRDLQQAILNLVVNAAHAIGEAGPQRGGEKGSIRVATRRDGPWAEIRVEDDGLGIPEDIRERVFEPFFTTKPLGRGSGQGLSVVHAVIVKKHHGTVHFETEVGRGTTFIIRLPLQQSSDDSANPAPDAVSGETYDAAHRVAG